ncbi:hypothetical protein WJX73_008907 [Symbiochloris irregularis]|uniref:Vacuolar protein sorting-associated protein 29 n=1 Tax=Symbiochloris irregularis TaxID=706552 RepID=A0AAW1NM50_9CHLO
MVLVLCIGDLHIPHRQTDLPSKFKSLLVPGKIHHILSTGNLCTSEVYDYLKTVCSDLHVARGDFDEPNKYPDEEVLQVGAFRIGLCHGHQVVPWGNTSALALLQRRLNVDILVTGHTHQYWAEKFENRFIINPGSATGAYSTMTTKPVPSFVLMDVDGDKATVYYYELHGEELKVDKSEFSKSA